MINPEVKDTARYNLVVKVEKDVFMCSGYLEVTGSKTENEENKKFPIYDSLVLLADADPEYYIVKKFKEKMTGYTNRSVKLVCVMNEPGAKIKWLKDGHPISVRYTYY